MPKTFADLVELMDRLRDPGGCPWDREQTYATLAPMLLEEAYEAFDAMEEARLGRFDNLREELGDLLFQITFFARVAKEKGEFAIDDVITQVHEKMAREIQLRSCVIGRRSRPKKSALPAKAQKRTPQFWTVSRPKPRR